MAPPGARLPLLLLATPGLDPLIPKPNVFPAQTDLAIAGRQMTLHQAAELAQLLGEIVSIDDVLELV